MGRDRDADRPNAPVENAVTAMVVLEAATARGPSTVPGGYR
jgi:hypothetical protein